jgi:hypothetical protein
MQFACVALYTARLDAINWSFCVALVHCSLIKGIASIFLSFFLSFSIYCIFFFSLEGDWKILGCKRAKCHIFC